MNNKTMKLSSKNILFVEGKDDKCFISRILDKEKCFFEIECLDGINKLNRDLAKLLVSSIENATSPEKIAFMIDLDDKKEEDLIKKINDFMDFMQFNGNIKEINNFSTLRIKENYINIYGREYCEIGLFVFSRKKQDHHSLALESLIFSACEENFPLLCCELSASMNKLKDIIHKNYFQYIKPPLNWDKTKIRSFLALHKEWSGNTIDKLFQEKIIHKEQKVFYEIREFIEKLN